MPDRTLPLLPGTLELLVLRALRWEPTHGAGVAEWIRMVTAGVFALEEGTFYPALQRMERGGLIEGEWGRSDHNRRARFYNLTSDGRQRLRHLEDAWTRYAGAVNAALRHGHPRALWAGERAPGGN
jgi:transcriptional regulator